ncbi:MAG: hypothetical protein J6X66_12295, partial [Lachnospiraceae bacterium]|nr:hypothetical protein [Lachnospiraceae bacterium]
MKRRKVLAMLMTAVMTFTSIAPQNALLVRAEDDVVIESVSDEDADAETSDDAAVSEDTAVLADEADAAEEKELPAGIKGMPESYVMSAEEKTIKANVASHNVAGEVKAAVAGVDYTSDEVLLLADDEEYAELVAEAYGAELESFDGYVAVLDLSKSGLSVADAVAIGADPSYDIPAVEANYLIKVETGYEGWTNEEIEGYSRWKYRNTEDGWIDEVGKMSNRDPYLNPDDINYQWFQEVIGSYGAWGVYGYDFS